MSRTRRRAEADALVVLWREPRDRTLAREHGWYRAQTTDALTRLGDLGRFRTLAFYQPDAFGRKDSRRIRYQAAVERIESARRLDLLPGEPDHPRAGEPYTVFRLGALEELAAPIVSHRGRRLLFIPTTTQRLKTANELNELVLGNRVEDTLYRVMRADGLTPEREYWVQYDLGVPSERPELRKPPGKPASFFCDFAVFCKHRDLDIETDGDAWHANPEKARSDRERDNLLESKGWHVLRFNEDEVYHRREETIGRIREAVTRYGGLKEPDGSTRHYSRRGKLGPAQTSLDLFPADDPEE